MKGQDLFYEEHEDRKDDMKYDVKTTPTTGPGAPAEETIEKSMDLNEQLIKNKRATFFMRVNTQAMTGTGIYCGDIVIVDRLLEAKDGRIIIAVLNGEMLIRRLQILPDKKIRLVPETRQLSSIEIHSLSDFWVWGVVTYVIRIV